MADRFLPYFWSTSYSQLSQKVVQCLSLPFIVRNFLSFLLAENFWCSLHIFLIRILSLELSIFNFEFKTIAQLSAYIIFHLTCYVSTLPEITQKPKVYVVFLSVVWVALKRTDLSCKWLWREPVVWLDHSSCSKWRPFAFKHAHSHVCHWSMASSMMPWGIRCQVSMNLCFSSLMSCCQVEQKHK